jgi:hypothetical protein
MPKILEAIVLSSSADNYINHAEIDCKFASLPRDGERAWHYGITPLTGGKSMITVRTMLTVAELAAAGVKDFVWKEIEIKNVGEFRGQICFSPKERQAGRFFTDAAFGEKYLTDSLSRYGDDIKVSEVPTGREAFDGGAEIVAINKPKKSFKLSARTFEFSLNLGDAALQALYLTGIGAGRAFGLGQVYAITKPPSKRV